MDVVKQKTIKGYELKEKIETGGFGAVYRAYQSTVGREVAVKIILPALANQSDFIRRFEGEAQVVARLEHPHITPLYDYWRDPEGAYLVMRWLRGGSLQDALKAGKFELRAAALLLDQIAGALSLAHRNGIIHRDIKPANILLDEDGNAYLTDFGIAKDLNIQGNNTQPDMIVGSLDYISPEQARSEPVTNRTDIYSLAVTLFEIITGHHPFENMSSIERLYKHINDPLPNITGLDAAISDQVNLVIQKATAKNPEQRYADALAFAADFREAIGLNRASTTVVELLTQREHEILALIIEGLSNKEIAQKLTITYGTVKWYVSQIYDKLGVRGRVQAMVRARELNLLSKGGKALDALQILTEDFQPDNPYKGLRAFQSADNQDFFGREKITAKLLKRISERVEFGRFLAVVGPSGSGKSSLVKAGLIPALWRGDLPASEKWYIVELTPATHPIDELEIALMKLAANQGSNLHEQLRRDANGLLRAAKLILPNDETELVLVIDQFEEVFTMSDNEEARKHFLDLLYAAVSDAKSRVRVIITLRADFYDRPLHYPQFGEMLRNRLETILPLSAEELERAISKPAERVGAVFESGLVASMVADMNYQAGALPLLQYALTELFEHRKGRLLSREAYEAMGKSTGSLAKRADEIYEAFDEDGKAAAKQLFLRLVTVTEGAEDTRRRASRMEVLGLGDDPETMEEVIDSYSNYRLLTLDNDPVSRTPTVELAHEAILREWQHLRDWLNESRDDLRIQRQLSTMTQEWAEAKRDKSFLARGSRLETFEKWVESTSILLTTLEREFLAKSLEGRKVEAQKEADQQAREKVLERRSQKILKALVGVLLLATLGAFGLTGVAISQGQIAQKNAREVQNVALTAGSQAALANGNTDEAIALAIQALTLDPNSSSAQIALGQAAYMPGTVRVFLDHNASVWSVDFSPDGRTALSAGDDLNVILWDVETGTMIRHFDTGHTQGRIKIEFSPNGQTAISASEDGLLILWDIATETVIRRFEGHTGSVGDVTFSPDGQTILSCGQDRVLKLWDVATGELIRQFDGHTAAVNTVIFSADGLTALSGSQDKTLILWELATGTLLRRFEGSTDAQSVGLSLDGRYALSGGIRDTKVYLWDLSTGAIIHTFAGHTGPIHDVKFSPDGQHIVSASEDGTLILWNLEAWQIVRRLVGHSAGAHQSDFSSDGRYILSASADGTIRLWDTEVGYMVRRLPRQEKWIISLNIT